MFFGSVNCLPASEASDAASKQHPTNSKQCTLTNSTNGPPPSTATTGTMQHYMREISEASKPKTSPTLTSCAEASLAKAIAWLANDKDSKTHAEPSFMKLCGLQKKNNPRLYFSKTSPDYSAVNKETLFKQSLKKWGNWGIYVSGKFLTADFSESLSPVAESSLSHILQSQTEVGEPFFLSPKAMTTVIRKLLLGGKSFRPRLLRALEQHAILEATPW